MNLSKLAVVAAAALLGAAAASSALAGPPRGGHGAYYGHGYRGHAPGGVYLGLALGWPYWAGYPYWGSPYYYPPYGERVVVVPSEPSVYVEQPRVESAPGAGYWYYCAGAGAYYPYVQECPGGWQRVSPRPPGE